MNKHFTNKPDAAQVKETASLERIQGLNRDRHYKSHKKRKSHEQSLIPHRA